MPRQQITEEEYIAQLQREGWEVSKVQLNEDEFDKIVTISSASANVLTEVIAISPPSGAELRILRGYRFWVYGGGTAGEWDPTLTDIRVTRLRADGTEDRIASGIYDNFNNKDEETVYRFDRNIMVTPADTLRIKVKADKATTTSGVKFALDCLILQKRV